MNDRYRSCVRGVPGRQGPAPVRALADPAAPRPPRRHLTRVLVGVAVAGGAAMAALQLAGLATHLL